MKKINSINYAHKIIGTAVLFLLTIPALSYFIRCFIRISLLWFLGKASFFIGTGITVFFIILLTIEFHQDRQIDKHYQQLKNSRIKLSSGCFECQFCGSRQMKSSDRSCPACGIKFIKRT